MKKKILTILGIVAIPMGALLLNSCGPTENMEQELALDEASDSFLVPVLSEYGHCNDTLDNDGNGLVDSHDWGCHISPGPLRDLSLFDFPIGHNFWPDLSRTLPIGPGWDGDFREPEMIADWLTFLTEPDGNIAGIDVLYPGWNPEVVPLHPPRPYKIPLGTLAQGNNNNIDLRALHMFHLEHGFLPASGVLPLADDILPLAKAPEADVTNLQKWKDARRTGSYMPEGQGLERGAPIATGAPIAPGAAAVGVGIAGVAVAEPIAPVPLLPDLYVPPFYDYAQGFPGWPGQLYRSQGPWSGWGSQGALKPARTGNGDGGGSVIIPQ